jgi:hypothetical protein
MHEIIFSISNIYFAEILIMINTYIVFIAYFAITAYNETNSFHHIKKTLLVSILYSGMYALKNIFFIFILRKVSRYQIGNLKPQINVCPIISMYTHGNRGTQRGQCDTGLREQGATPYLIYSS